MYSGLLTPVVSLSYFSISLLYFTNISLTHCILIINSFKFCYKEIKHLFLFEHSLPGKLQNIWQLPAQSLCKQEFTGCCAGTFGNLLSGYWDLFIFWWTSKLGGHGPCQVFRYQLQKAFLEKLWLALQHREWPMMHHIFLIYIMF